MPIFADQLSAKRYSVHNGSIADHLDVYFDYFKTRFDGMQHTMRVVQAMQKFERIFKKYSIAEADYGKTFGGARPTNLSGVYSEFKAAAELELQLAIQYFEPLDDPEEDDNYETLVGASKVTFAHDGIKVHLTAMAETKIASIYHMGPGHRHTPGPRRLHSRAVHAHVTNDDGLAFIWSDASSSTSGASHTLQILGYGPKDDSAPSDSSGYKWLTR